MPHAGSVSKNVLNSRMNGKELLWLIIAQVFHEDLESVGICQQNMKHLSNNSAL